jgi:hypothetical protein
MGESYVRAHLTPALPGTLILWRIFVVVAKAGSIK